VSDILDKRPFLMLWEVQSESTVKGFGDVSLGDSASVAAELADSLVAPALWFILSKLKLSETDSLERSRRIGLSTLQILAQNRQSVAVIDVVDGVLRY